MTAKLIAATAITLAAVAAVIAFFVRKSQQ